MSRRALGVVVVALGILGPVLAASAQRPAKAPGEICGALKGIFGQHKEPVAF